MLAVFTVRDAKAEAYLQPFYLRSKGEAIRVITDLVNDESHQFNKHPEDFSIYYLGEYDEATGKHILADNPVLLLPVGELKNVLEPIETVPPLKAVE